MGGLGSQPRVDSDKGRGGGPKERGWQWGGVGWGGGIAKEDGGKPACGPPARLSSHAHAAKAGNGRGACGQKLRGGGESASQRQALFV